MKRFFVVALAATALAAGGCASSGSASSGNEPAADRKAPDIITHEEIAANFSNNAYDLVFRLRPTWLRARGTSSIANGNISEPKIAVYLDNHRLGDIGALRTMSISGIASMRWLDAARASNTLSGIGSEAIAGAIVIKSQ